MPETTNATKATTVATKQKRHKPRPTYAVKDGVASTSQLKLPCYQRPKQQKARKGKAGMPTKLRQNTHKVALDGRGAGLEASMTTSSLTPPSSAAAGAL